MTEWFPLKSSAASPNPFAQVFKLVFGLRPALPEARLRCYAECGPVAQWLELAAHNSAGAGSSPARPTISFFDQCFSQRIVPVGHSGAQSCLFAASQMRHLLSSQADSLAASMKPNIAFLGTSGAVSTDAA
jgi:hypothetical protein